MENKTVGHLIVMAALVLSCSLAACSQSQTQETAPVGWEKISDGTAASGVQDGAGSSEIAGQGAESAAAAQTGSSSDASQAGGAQADANGAAVAASDSTGTTAGDTAGAAAGFSYADIAKQEFYFSSGVGGWHTELRPSGDGSFEGLYQDSDMGDSGDGYPNGTLYYCEFSGQFDALQKVDDYTYKTVLKSLSLNYKDGETEIKDGIRYIYSVPYGLDGAKDLYFYLPGKPIDSLPESFLSWVPMAKDTEKDGKMTIYGLYNESTGDGFGGYPIYEPDNQASDSGSAAPASGPAAALTAEVLKTHLEDAQAASDEIDRRMKEEDMSQLQYNLTAEEQYVLWDDLLNEIWSYLKTTLPEDRMKSLTDEQVKWIGSKEAAAEKEGRQYEGGSIQGMIINGVKADMTRDRVYELMEYVK